MTRTRWLLLNVVLFTFVASGCGGPKAQDNKNADGTINVRGTVSVRGSSPGSLIVLQGRDGKLYEIQASRIGEELRSLDGMDVAVEALVVPGFDQQEPVLAVRYYDILNLPSGERPIVGTVRIMQGDTNDMDNLNVYLYDQNEVVWLISGQFVEVFGTFAGAKVWVVGVTQKRLDTLAVSVRTLMVTEYGVIRP